MREELVSQATIFARRAATRAGKPSACDEKQSTIHACQMSLGVGYQRINRTLILLNLLSEAWGPWGLSA
jgi:hypothetical protein